MTTLPINDELRLDYPDSFCEMDEQQMKRFFTSTENRRGIYDENNHILLSVAWTKPGFLNLFTDAKTILRQSENAMKRGLENYRRIEAYDTVIVSKTARGIRFSFLAQDSEIRQSGELLVFRLRNRFYAITFVAREEDIEESRVTFRKIMQTLTTIS